MRWIKGDTLPHIDYSHHTFENTYLIYLNDSPGEIIIGDESYPILNNTAYIFNEGVHHETKNTGNVPRLLLGPMNEFVEPVGSPIIYFANESDALNVINIIGFTASYTLEEKGGFTHWRIASNSSGTSSQSVVYNVGDTLINDGVYYVYPGSPCFLEGTKILCLINGKEEYVQVEKLEKGIQVKTSMNGYKKVEIIANGLIQNIDTNERIENRLYKLTKEKYPELNEDLFITGCHSILVDNITDIQREKTIKSLGKIFVTDKKYRLMAFIDERAEPWLSKEVYNIWHFALENDNDKMNYGVYANGNLLVETCSLYFLKNKSNLSLNK